ncbi:MAG: ABC transporter permease [Deltaproteobacteria bacterium]|nr:ABC transporter permease [Deltaproteobacteria bacterium]
MNPFYQVFRNELRAIFSDAGVLLVFVGAIVVYSFFYPLPYLPQVLRDVPVVVVDQDGSPLSRKLVRMCDAHPFLRVTGYVGSVPEAESRVREGQIGGLIVIPEGFAREIARGGQATVGLYADAGYFLVYRQVMTGMVTAARTLSAGVKIRRFQAGGKTEHQARAAQRPLSLITMPLFNPSEGYASYVVPAILVLILQQTLLIGIGMVGGTARENAKPGTDRVTCGPLAIITGKASAYLSLYMVNAVYYFFVVFGIYGFPQRGAPLTVMLFLLPFLLSIILLGLTLEGLFSRRETAIQVLLITSLPAVFLAGFSWPVEAIPSWLRWLSFLIPSTAGIEGFLQINEMGATLHDVKEEWLVLWGLCAFYYLLASCFLRHRMRLP